MKRSEESQAKTSPWCWCGTVSDDSNTAQYQGLIVVNPAQDEASIHFCDGSHSFITTTTPESLASSEDKSLATISSESRLGKLKHVLDSLTDSHLAKGSARITDSGLHGTAASKNSPALRISAAWGAEFELTDLHLDIASVPLEKKPGNGNFLDAAFSRLSSSRQRLAEAQKKQKQVTVEIEDLEEARACLQAMQTEAMRKKRLQAFADTLNAYKLQCSDKAPC